MRRAILMLALLAAALWSAPSLAQSRANSGRSAPPTPRRPIRDRRLQQDHRAESVFRREARDHLFLARGRLEQEGQLHAGDRGCQRSDPAAPERRRLQSARLGLLRQGRVRHRDRGFQRRAAHRAAERHHLPQPRQRLARQGRLRQGDRRLRSGDQARAAVGVFLAEPRHFETGARRSRRRAGRHQRGDPARSGAAAAADQPRGDLARQGRSRSRHRRRAPRRSGSPRPRRRPTS